ncbi:MAG: flagellar filament capping protein FliD, partial [Bryobacteraceae bacterium]
MSSSALSNLITLATFNGQSTYSADFQNELDKAVSLQCLNLDNMQAEQTTDENKQSALDSLDQQFTSLQTAITSLSTATGLSSLSASVSDTSVASVALSDGATPATYTLEVDNVGSHTETYSSDGLQTVTDPNSENISSSSSFTLTVGSNSYTVTGSTLQDLANSINSNSSYGVTASIVNDGSSSSPDYRLALQATNLGDVSVQLNDGSQNLLTTLSTGTSASYKVDGLPNAITSDSDSVTLGPGVTATLLGTNSGSPATITVSPNSSSVQSALQSFVSAYNSVVSQLGESYGQSANALQGDPILFAAQNALQSMVDYTGSDGSPLSSIGLDLSNIGQLSFNSSEFDAGTSQGMSAALQFLGSSTSGFIQAATNAVTDLEDPTEGSIKLEEQQLTSNLSDLSNNINTEVTRVNNFQQNMLTQLSEADASIYSLQ